jgi:hypothetical protein
MADKSKVLRAKRLMSVAGREGKVSSILRS